MPTFLAQLLSCKKHCPFACRGATRHAALLVDLKNAQVQGNVKTSLLWQCMVRWTIRPRFRGREDARVCQRAAKAQSMWKISSARILLLGVRTGRRAVRWGRRQLQAGIIGQEGKVAGDGLGFVRLRQWQKDVRKHWSTRLGILVCFNFLFLMLSLFFRCFCTIPQSPALLRRQGKPA